MMKLRYVLPFLLAGCAPTPDAGLQSGTQPPVNTSGLEERLPDTCKLTNYQSFVGQPLAATAIPGDIKSRTVKPGTILSQEYVADRVNFYVDETGVITRVICG